METASKIWMDGNLVDWQEARVHVLTHTLHYGLGVFEGLRCYKTVSGPAIFRLQEHVARLFHSARITGLQVPFSREEITEATVETVRSNGLDACYIRPLVYVGDGRMGLNFLGIPVRVAIAVWPWGTYLGEEGLSNGIRVKISSFSRHHPNVSMTKAKVCGNYVNSQLAKAEAMENGYDEALLLDVHGNVAEGSGENIFCVKGGVLMTPPLAAVLEGITRDTILTLGRDRGLTCVETVLSRDQLYVADEAFFTGTAAEVTPIREIDNRKIGEGKPGPVTGEMQQAFFDVVLGRDNRYKAWLTYL